MDSNIPFLRFFWSESVTFTESTFLCMEINKSPTSIISSININSTRMGRRVCSYENEFITIRKAAGLSYIPSKIPSHAENGIIPSMDIIKRYLSCYLVPTKVAVIAIGMAPGFSVKIRLPSLIVPCKLPVFYSTNSYINSTFRKKYK